MDLAGHEKSSLEIFGSPFTEVHIFLDSYSKKYRGFSHRILLHHRLGVELCVEKFGEQARAAAIQHITEDLGFVPDSWKDLEKFYFPLLDEEILQYQDLVELYGPF